MLSDLHSSEIFEEVDGRNISSLVERAHLIFALLPRCRSAHTTIRQSNDGATVTEGLAQGTYRPTQ